MGQIKTSSFRQFGKEVLDHFPHSRFRQVCGGPLESRADRPRRSPPTCGPCASRTAGCRSRRAPTECEQTRGDGNTANTSTSQNAAPRVPGHDDVARAVGQMVRFCIGEILETGLTLLSRCRCYQLGRGWCRSTWSIGSWVSRQFKKTPLGLARRDDAWSTTIQDMLLRT